MTDFKFNLLNIISETFSNLSDGREKQIIIHRFGLDGQKPKTLEMIGKVFNITRERVRQIERNAVAKISKHKRVEKLEKIIAGTVEDNGGLVTTEYLIKSFLKENDKLSTETNIHINYLKLLLYLNKNIIQIKKNKEIKECWCLKDFDKNLIKKVLESAILYLSKKKTITKIDTLSGALSKLDIWTKNKYNLDKKKVFAILKASQKIVFVSKDKVGLKSWPTVDPKNIRDKIFFILKRTKKPLHFTEITNLINQSQFSQRKATTQAVHNELIKDNRFVLIGRGIYALSEWGYNPGTVAEIIKKVLSSTKKPLGIAEIVDKVLDERQVKKSTIILNLQEKEEFVRVGKGIYTLNHNRSNK